MLTNKFRRYADRLPKAWTSSLVAQTQLARLRSRTESVSAPSVASETPTEETACSEALTRSYSLLFGLGQLTEGLYLLHDLATREQPKKLRLYLAHTLADKVHRFFRPKDTLNLQQALAILHGQPYTEPRKPFVHYIVRAERWAWSQRSTYAAKVAMAATVYAVFALAPVLQEQVFLKIGQVSALITVIVAVAPTLGGTLSTWLFQISGTGAGALLGFITLEVFKDTGGYRYNPYVVRDPLTGGDAEKLTLLWRDRYGITAIGAIWFAWSSYKFLLHPAKYTQSLLYVVGYGGIVLQEYMHSDLPGVESQYDSPPLRFGQLRSPRRCQVRRSVSRFRRSQDTPSRASQSAWASRPYSNSSSSASLPAIGCACNSPTPCSASRPTTPSSRLS